MKRHCWVFFMVILFGAGLFLRLYQRDAAMYYMNDQGLLLLTSYRAVWERAIPHAGPPVSIAGAYLPPFMYYLVGLFFLLGSDPLAVALGYIVLNVLAGVLLGMWVRQVTDAATGVIAFGLAMFSASLVENGRSIWQAHPAYFFVVLYLWMTTLAARQKNLWIYILGVLVYVSSIGFYPTPLILLPFVLACTAAHLRSFGGILRRYHACASVLLVGGLTGAVYVPWLVTQRFTAQSTILHVIGLFSSVATPAQFIASLYAYMSEIVHDLFRLQVILPPHLAGSPWLKLVVALGVLGIVWTAQLRHVPARLRVCCRSPYIYLLAGVGLLACFGIRMPPYRLLPLYPFVLFGFAVWIRAWTKDARIIQRTVIAALVVLFLYGNGTHWWHTTVTHPRNEYAAAGKMADVIIKDATSHRISVSDMGVHYFTPLDTNDYYASPVFYLLHRSIGYPVSYTPPGNELARGERETRNTVYVICYGFNQEEDRREQCIRPFVMRWPEYALIRQLQVESAWTVAVFLRAPVVADDYVTALTKGI